MYQPGDLVIYGGEGVCRVEKVGALSLSNVKSEKLYYTLAPLYREGTIFAPVDGKVFMRPIIDRAEAEELVRQIPEINGEIYENRNVRMLNEHYQQMFQSHECADMVQLIKAVYAKQKAIQAAGRKAGQVDERYMKRAEDMLYGELAAALDIPKDSVADYIANSVKKHAANS